jgi:hypothetical protein
MGLEPAQLRLLAQQGCRTLERRQRRLEVEAVQAEAAETETAGTAELVPYECAPPKRHLTETETPLL